VAGEGARRLPRLSGPTQLPRAGTDQALGWATGLRLASRAVVMPFSGDRTARTLTTACR
jgi:hypothetical protein